MSSTKKSFFSLLLRASIPLAVILAGVLLAWFFVFTKPVAVRAPARAVSPQVRVISVESGDVPLTIQALGTVSAAQQISLRTRVGGQVAYVSPKLEPGNILKANEEVLRIDATDYANEVRRAEAAYAKSKADYDLEMGMQTVAKNEYDQIKQLLPGKVNTANPSLALRGPQLSQAKAALDISGADLEKAKVNLARATISAPFNALVLSRDVALGQQASTSESLATLVGTDAYWVDAAVPLDRLHLLGVYLTPDMQLPVKVFSTNGVEWPGTLLQSSGTLSDSSRMGRILVEVEDPFGLKSPDGLNPRQPLLLGDQVRVEMVPRTLENTVTIPRTALRSNDQVWLVDAENKLRVRSVEVLWKDGDNVYINKGLEEKALLVVSDMSSVIDGMLVRPWSRDEETQAGIQTRIQSLERAASVRQGAGS